MDSGIYKYIFAGAMVALAKQWKSVPARYHCEAGSDKTVRYVHNFEIFITYMEGNICILVRGIYHMIPVMQKV